MSIYDLEKLMTETRKLAAHYRITTGQSLPVTVELARFDAITRLKLTESDDSQVEATRGEGDALQVIQIKGRVIFSGGKSRQRVGHLNLQSVWDYTVLVIYNADYEPQVIYQASREVLEQALSQMKENKRGAMTVSKFKAIGELLWQTNESDESSDKKMPKNECSDIPREATSTESGLSTKVP